MLQSCGSFSPHNIYMGLERNKNNVFVGHLSPENLQKYSREAVNATQVYAARPYDWLPQNYKYYQRFSDLE
jgi:hypothetical protein